MGILKKHPILFMGLGITILFFVFAVMKIEFIEALDLKFYDVMMNLRGDPDAQSDIVLVDIDDDSIEKLGRWPWRRSLLADIIKKIDAGNPKAIGLNIILSEPEKSDGLAKIAKLEDIFSITLLEETGEKGKIFLQTMKDIRIDLDNDKKLADAIKASGKVVLPVFLQKSIVISDETETSDQQLIDHSIQNIISPSGAVYPRSNEIVQPIPSFMSEAYGIGHINLAYDIDGKARRDWPAFEYRGIFIPSYALKLTSMYLNIPGNKMRADLSANIHLGRHKIPTTLNTEFLISFKGPGGSFKRYSFFDVINDKLPPAIFKNKIVLVSPSATGVINPLSTPTDNYMTLGEFTANSIWATLNKNVILQPSWNDLANILMIFFLGMIITFVFPRLKALIAGIAFFIFFIALIAISAYFFISKGLWIQTAYPLSLLILGYIGVISMKYFVTETKKEKVEGESAESNRMLGLSFQSQGMLDMAFDKLRRVPVDKQLKDSLYNLALDYERKRQLSKAATVYEYIEEHDRKYKDVSAKKKKLIQASETMVYGDGGLMGRSDDLLATGTGTKPTLGRYEVLKQLGKGAMGIVYLGQDPRINRTTAIKTFSFADDIDTEQVQDLKEKFFREAESAGTLSHPNIVTIYDAGDEHDLAYIAMEYLEGDDLEKHTKKANLLPMRKTIGYMADIAEALNYAHEKGIVHRDIKPANIMLLKSGIVKITDFGIARITATSQTQTGVVKGTPYYMSPEQFSGEKVDGRSDIFSLGTMMFQLLTGILPFKGDSPAALMNQIMNVPHPNPKTINSKIISPIIQIIDKALEKDRENRYQRASTLSKHLKDVTSRIDAALAKKKTESNAE